MDTIGEMKITTDNEVYKSFKELQELKEAEERVSTTENSKEKNYLYKEYLRMDREFFEELKCSEVAKEIGLIVVRELYELYFSEKKSKE